MKKILGIIALLLVATSCENAYTAAESAIIVSIERKTDDSKKCYAELGLKMRMTSDDTFWVGCNCDEVNVGDTMYFIPTKKLEKIKGKD